MQRCDPWPLNPKGELLLGVKLESPEGVANCESILAVPGLGFAEIGPGDLSLSLGYLTIPREPYPMEMQTARDRILATCRKNGIAFLQGCTTDNVIARIDEGSASDRGAQRGIGNQGPGTPEAEVAGVILGLSNKPVRTTDHYCEDRDFSLRRHHNAGCDWSL